MGFTVAAVAALPKPCRGQIGDDRHSLVLGLTFYLCDFLAWWYGTRYVNPERYYLQSVFDSA
ncbi:hypothetical protein B0T20DRAFT_482787 [Sordaria brevicollis]|uniref:Uncharacterized protein n=1 Tax=Sordaria brevicollis TaxID=83679 RepID=A0AAE0P3H3_SORBR|nr:hypothetical protein B0T20DRAFT_482787 [Sordaria brevicollis]